MNKKRLSQSVCFGMILGLFLTTPVTLVHAEEENPVEPKSPQVKIEQLEGVEVRNDFSIGPTKFTLDLKPSEEIVAELQITSRIEKETDFEVGVEDFTSQEDPEKYTKFLGEEKSQFSSKEWFAPAVWEFTLKHGERIFLPVKITVPKDAEFGDHYSAVFVKTVPKEDEKGTGINLSSRVGSLFLLSIGDGEVKTAGELASFKTSKKVYGSWPMTFELNFKNQGDVHLTPFGKIIVSNLFGKTVDQVTVKDWVVLRSSSRTQRAVWEPGFAFGKYTASAQIERGYNNLTDVKTTTFYVLPVKILGGVLGGLIALAILVKFFTAKFEIKRKKTI